MIGYDEFGAIRIGKYGAIGTVRAMLNGSIRYGNYRVIRYILIPYTTVRYRIYLPQSTLRNVSQCFTAPYSATH